MKPTRRLGPIDICFISAAPSATFAAYGEKSEGHQTVEAGCQVGQAGQRAAVNRRRDRLHRGHPRSQGGRLGNADRAEGDRRGQGTGQDRGARSRPNRVGGRYRGQARGQENGTGCGENLGQASGQANRTGCSEDLGKVRGQATGTARVQANRASCGEDPGQVCGDDDGQARGQANQTGGGKDDHHARGADGGQDVNGQDRCQGAGQDACQADHGDPQAPDGHAEAGLRVRQPARLLLAG